MVTQRKLNRNAYTESGEPKYLRIYDSGEEKGFMDRITVVFTQIKDGEQHYLAMSLSPFHPQGVCQHGSVPAYSPIDSPKYSHLGKKITWDQLGELSVKCQDAVMQDYTDYWGVWEKDEDQEWEIRELEMYLMGEEDLYKRFYAVEMEMLRRVRGGEDREKVAKRGRKATMSTVIIAAHRYKEEITLPVRFSNDTIKKVAAVLVSDFMINYDGGYYDYVEKE